MTNDECLMTNGLGRGRGVGFGAGGRLDRGDGGR